MLCYLTEISCCAIPYRVSVLCYLTGFSCCAVYRTGFRCCDIVHGFGVLLYSINMYAICGLDVVIPSTVLDLLLLPTSGLDVRCSTVRDPELVGDLR